MTVISLPVLPQMAAPPVKGAATPPALPEGEGFAVLMAAHTLPQPIMAETGLTAESLVAGDLPAADGDEGPEAVDLADDSPPADSGGIDEVPEGGLPIVSAVVPDDLRDPPQVWRGVSDAWGQRGTFALAQPSPTGGIGETVPPFLDPPSDASPDVGRVASGQGPDEDVRRPSRSAMPERAMVLSDGPALSPARPRPAVVEAALPQAPCSLPGMPAWALVAQEGGRPGDGLASGSTFDVQPAYFPQVARGGGDPLHAYPLRLVHAPEPHAPAEMVARISRQIIQGADQATEVRLDPPELGSLRFLVTTSDQGVSLRLQADSPETAELLRRHIDVLAGELRHAGYSSVDVSIDRRQSQGFAGDHAAQEGEEPAPDAFSVVGTAVHATGATGLDLRL